MKNVTSVGEFGLHAMIREWVGAQRENVIIGPGDDAAVIKIPTGYELVITTDASSSMKSTNMSDAVYSAKQCVVRNFSDILAMGGKPTAFLLVLRIPRETSLDYVESVVRSTSSEVARYEASLVGGDIKEHNEIIMDGTAIGIVPQGKALRRSGAKKGDIVAITLSKGIKLGARWAQEIVTHDPHLLAQHGEFVEANYKLHHLELPYHEMMLIAELGHATSAIDTSDGILACLSIVGRASHVAFELQYEWLSDVVHPVVFPLAKELGEDPVKFLFSMGHEWECVVTIESDYFDVVRKRIRDVGGDLAPLGFVVGGEDTVTLSRSDQPTQELSLFTGEKFVDKPYGDHVQVWRDIRIFH